MVTTFERFARSVEPAGLLTAASADAAQSPALASALGLAPAPPSRPLAAVLGLGKKAAASDSAAAPRLPALVATLRGKVLGVYGEPAASGGGGGGKAAAGKAGDASAPHRPPPSSEQLVRWAGGLAAANGVRPSPGSARRIAASLAAAAATFPDDVAPDVAGAAKLLAGQASDEGGGEVGGEAAGAPPTPPSASAAAAAVPEVSSFAAFDAACLAPTACVLAFLQPVGSGPGEDAPAERAAALAELRLARDQAAGWPAVAGGGTARLGWGWAEVGHNPGLEAGMQITGASLLRLLPLCVCPLPWLLAGRRGGACASSLLTVRSLPPPPPRPPFLLFVVLLFVAGPFPQVALFHKDKSRAALMRAKFNAPNLADFADRSAQTTTPNTTQPNTHPIGSVVSRSRLAALTTRASTPPSPCAQWAVSPSTGSCEQGVGGRGRVGGGAHVSTSGGGRATSVVSESRRRYSTGTDTAGRSRRHRLGPARSRRRP